MTLKINFFQDVAPVEFDDHEWAYEDEGMFKVYQRGCGECEMHEFPLINVMSVVRTEKKED